MVRGFRVLYLGFRFWVLGFGIWGLGFGVLTFGQADLIENFHIFGGRSKTNKGIYII
jgi:hypothetical protein